MIPVRMYQDDRQLAWETSNFSKINYSSQRVGSIHRPLGNRPSTLPLSHSAD